MFTRQGLSSPEGRRLPIQSINKIEALMATHDVS